MAIKHGEYSVYGLLLAEQEVEAILDALDANGNAELSYEIYEAVYGDEPDTEAPPKPAAVDAALESARELDEILKSIELRLGLGN